MSGTAVPKSCWQHAQLRAQCARGRGRDCIAEQKVLTVGKIRIQRHNGRTKARWTHSCKTPALTATEHWVKNNETSYNEALTYTDMKQPRPFGLLLLHLVMKGNEPQRQQEPGWQVHTRCYRQPQRAPVISKMVVGIPETRLHDSRRQHESLLECAWRCGRSTTLGSGHAWQCVGKAMSALRIAWHCGGSTTATFGKIPKLFGASGFRDHASTKRLEEAKSVCGSAGTVGRTAGTSGDLKKNQQGLQRGARLPPKNIQKHLCICRALSHQVGELHLQRPRSVATAGLRQERAFWRKDVTVPQPEPWNRRASRQELLLRATVDWSPCLRKFLKLLSDPHANTQQILFTLNLRNR